MVPIPIISHENSLTKDSVHPTIHILDHVTCSNEMQEVFNLLLVNHLFNIESER